MQARKIADILYNMALVSHPGDEQVMEFYKENVSAITEDIEMLKLENSRLYGVLEIIATRNKDREAWIIKMKDWENRK